MPHHTGVLAASIILIACLGMNMGGYPEVWKMLRNGQAVAAAPSKTPSVDNISLPKPVAPPKKEEPKPEGKTPKSTNFERPIPVEPFPKKEEIIEKPAEINPLPKKEDKTPSVPESKPAEPKQSTAKPIESKSAEPKPAPKKEEPKGPEPSPKKEEAAPKPSSPVPKKEEPKAPSPENVAAFPSESVERKTDPATLAAAFTPIVPLELRETENQESLLPKESAVAVDAAQFPDALKSPAPSSATPAYASEFKPKNVEPISPSTVDPLPSVFETLDSALARPIVYESQPTVEQRIAETAPQRIVPLPPTSTLKTLLPVSPTGPVKRLPLVD